MGKLDGTDRLGDVGHEALLATNSARLVLSAALSSACAAAAFYRINEGCIVLQEASGSIELSDETERAILAMCEPGASGHESSDSDSETKAWPALDGTVLISGQKAKFFAACVVRNGASSSVLVVAHPSRHAGLSPAQDYVLSTHARQLGVEPLPCRRSVQLSQPTSERLRLLESVVVHANDAVLITEAEPIEQPGPRIVYCNAAFTKTTGYTEAEILGLTPRILQSPKINRAALDQLRGALKRWEPVEVELLNVRKDGTEFWVELSIVPVADDTGWFTHWVSVQREVSHRKQAEEVATRARIAEVENRALAAELRERKHAEARLTHAAFHDDLTQLYNRAYLMDRLGPVLAQRICPADPAGSVLFLDLDRFKLVNDSLGHRSGDLLLIEVAQRLRNCMRPSDILARIGGDEFAVLIEGADEAGVAVKLAERIIQALSKPIVLGTHQVFSLCSIGIAQISAQHLSPEDVLRDADIAMYQAKRAGAGGFQTFDTSMRVGAAEALALQTDLRHALGRDEFILHYQPIYDPITLSLTGLEALIRWQHPVRGLVPPGEFVPMAEEIGLIREIDRWVLETACRQMSRWTASDPSFQARISVNVSGDELRQQDFIPKLREVLHTTGIAPKRVQIEITESVFLNHPDEIADILTRIRVLGVRVALDDFGTGFSSLSYLDRFEIDTLKIDRTFVARMLGQRRTMAIIDTIVKLGTALDLDIVAEGVEEMPQLQILRNMGCGHVQGFLLGRPTETPNLQALPGPTARAPSRMSAVPEACPV